MGFSSRFIYILKSSNFELKEIIYFVLRYLFNIDDKNMKLIGFQARKFNTLDKNCLIKLNASPYQIEIKNYLNNQDLLFQELGLESLKDKQLVKKP